jgi:hypothetical protein
VIELQELEFMLARGWKLLPIHSATDGRCSCGRSDCGSPGKHPRTVNGVNDATNDHEQVVGWVRCWPATNLAVATGAPGPQVLDVDDPAKVPPEVRRWIRKTPRVATARGGHAYAEGTDAGTIKLDYGELRGRGSYVVVPPSTHWTGTVYRWVQWPRGPLPPVPALLTRTGKRAGCGEHQVPAAPIVAGEGRWPYLVDYIVRQLRAGIVDRGRLLAHLQLEFELACEALPAPGPGKLQALVDWGVGTRIADRERAAGELEKSLLPNAWWVHEH